MHVSSCISLSYKSSGNQLTICQTQGINEWVPVLDKIDDVMWEWRWVGEGRRGDYKEQVVKV